MRFPCTTTFGLLASLCIAGVHCVGESNQNPLKTSKDKAKILAACPAYEHYARSMQ